MLLKLHHQACRILNRNYKYNQHFFLNSSCDCYFIPSCPCESTLNQLVNFYFFQNILPDKIYNWDLYSIIIFFEINKACHIKKIWQYFLPVINLEFITESIWKNCIQQFVFHRCLKVKAISCEIATQRCYMQAFERFAQLNEQYFQNT